MYNNHYYIYLNANPVKIKFEHLVTLCFMLFVHSHKTRELTIIILYYNMNIFYRLEVMDRGSKTQLQVGENFKLFNLAVYWEQNVCLNSKI